MASGYQNEKWAYEDIVNLPYPGPSSRPRMDAANRAAQFSPFAALSGYDDAVKEEERLTEKRIELGNDEIEEINRVLVQLNERICEHPEITLCYFIPDEKKSGGRYVTVSGAVKKFDLPGQFVVLQDKTQVPMKDIVTISLS